MNCIKCGIKTVLGWDGSPMEFCQECSKESGNDDSVGKTKQSPKFKYRIAIIIHKLIGLIYIIFAVLAFLNVVVSYFIDYMEFNMKVLYGIPIIILLVFFHKVISKGLEKEKVWAGILSILVGIILLAGFPLGTIVGIILIFSIVKFWFSY